MKIVITKELLASAKTEAGGYTRAQMDVFNVAWPPPKGWPNFLVGKVVEMEQFEQFMDARLIRVKPKRQPGT